MTTLVQAMLIILVGVLGPLLLLALAVEIHFKKRAKYGSPIKFVQYSCNRRVRRFENRCTKVPQASEDAFFDYQLTGNCNGPWESR